MYLPATSTWPSKPIYSLKSLAALSSINEEIGATPGSSEGDFVQDPSSSDNSAGISGEAVFKCESCEKTFKSQRGLSLHKRKIHPVSYHEQKADEIINTISSKKKWTTKDMNTMAKIEANLLRTNIKFMNQELVKRIPGRSVESIKSKRKNTNKW